MGNRGLAVVVAGAKSGVSASARYTPLALPLAVNAFSVVSVVSTTLSWQRARANSLLLPSFLYPAATL